MDIKLKPNETPQDIIAQICDLTQLAPTQSFAFSAFYCNQRIKINIIPEANPYTIEDIIYGLDFTTKSYINPPLELYLSLFKPLFNKIVNQAYPYYAKLLTRDDLLSTLYITIVKLYNKNYYLHKQLIYKSFINELNMEIRHQKHFTDQISLSEPITNGEEEELTLLDTLIDTDETMYNLTHFTEDDYRKELFLKVKEVMLKDMSPLAFERILIQLKSKTVDSNTSRILAKYRRYFNEPI